MAPWNVAIIEEGLKRSRVKLGMALCVPFLAAGLQAYFWAYISPYIFVLFYPAVFLSGWLGGMLGGVIATILSVFLIFWFFIQPVHPIYAGQPSSYIAVAVFAVNGFIISFLFHILESNKGKYLASLHAYNLELEKRVLERTSELIDARNQIASFASEQDRVIELERRRISREVHDQIGQVFTAIKLIIKGIPHGVVPQDQEDALRQAIEMGVASTRKITAELRPPLLDDLGFVAALDFFGQEVAHSGNLKYTIAVEHDQQLDSNCTLGLFRITQEAVTNILRHANASRIQIGGRIEGGRYVFSIEDDGQGFDPAKIRKGAMGLISMQERARLLEGSCTVSSTAERGTRIEVSIPLKQDVNA